MCIYEWAVYRGTGMWAVYICVQVSGSCTRIQVCTAGEWAVHRCVQVRTAESALCRWVQVVTGSVQLGTGV